jgi:5'-deoxynucleotidase YfbR-like HD superfamily hydrolase
MEKVLKKHFEKRISKFEYSEAQLQRLLDWMNDEDRLPANIAFTAGTLRNCAYKFEENLTKKQ